MKQFLLLNPEQASTEKVASYKTRFAARGVVTDAQGNIALLKVGKYNYYKLPGGGIDDGEGIHSALKRECLEETGCHIEIDNKLGLIEEYRKMSELRQISYCCLAHVAGEKGQPDFCDDELAENFSVIWVPIKEAICLLENCSPTNKEGKDYIVPRDLCFLKNAVQALYTPPPEEGTP
ncbi:MAG: NUDIX domain-containing protein [Pseudomonadota bacterium]|nr:NUDIX domain-containing protein [Pseudomonadota bacterium]